MKKRTREEMATYRRDLRARQKAQNVTPAKVKTPVKLVTPRKKVVTPAPIIQAAAPSPVPCAECERLRAEIARLMALMQPKAALPLCPPVARPLAPKPAGKALDRSEQDALRQRVIDAKVKRINGFGKGHSIGSARI